jgi:predicted dehydrogenase
MNILNAAIASGTVKVVALCDVDKKMMGEAQEKVKTQSGDTPALFTDYREMLHKQKPEIVIIATPDHWHALPAIEALKAGCHIYLEKPICHTIDEGKAIVAAQKKYGKVVQVGLHRHIGPHNVAGMEFIKSGKVGDIKFVRAFVNYQYNDRNKRPDGEPPLTLDWDMYCGPAPLRPFNPHRVGGTHRGYWDQEGGGLADMAHHHLHALAYQYGRDLTAPVEITPYAPPAHPECCGLWGWCELKYADGFTLVLESTEWGERYSRLQHKNLGEGELLKMLSEEDRKKLDEMPDPVRLPFFEEAIRTRSKTGGNAERSHRVATIYHLANVAFRCGRPLKFDPVTEQIVGDEEANRLVNPPLRAPWRL